MVGPSLQAGRYLTSDFLSLITSPRSAKANIFYWALLFFLGNKQGQIEMTVWISFRTKYVLLVSKRSALLLCIFGPLWRNFPCKAESDCMRSWILMIGLQSTEEPSNTDEFVMTSQGHVETTTSGWKVQYPLTKPLGPPVMLMDLFSCCLDINSVY